MTFRCMFHEEDALMAIKRRRSDAVDFDGYFDGLRREFEGWGCRTDGEAELEPESLND